MYTNAGFVLKTAATLGQGRGRLFYARQTVGVGSTVEGGVSVRAVRKDKLAPNQIIKNTGTM